MNIAIVTKTLALTGVTTHIMDLAENLVEKGHNVFLFSTGVRDKENEANVALERKFKDVGGKVIFIPFSLKLRKNPQTIFQIIKCLFLVKRNLKKFEIDIIHIHAGELSIFPYLLRKPFIRTSHVPGFSLGAFSRLNIKATHEILISSDKYKTAKEKFNYKNDELSVILNGVSNRFAKLASEDQISAFKSKFNLPEEKTVIGIVGTIQPRKGYDLLLAAAEMLSEESVQKIHILFLGSGTKDGEKWLKNLIAKSPLKNQISKFEFQDPKPFYDVIDIFVLPSRSEPFGLVICEAYLSGCCVIRSDVGAAKDLIKDRKTGFIFKNEGVEELSEIIESLVLNKNLRDKTAKNGRDFALKNFTAEIMTEKTLSVYQKVKSN